MLPKGLTMFALVNKTTRILLVNFSSGWGGGELWFWSVGKQLIQHGMDVQWWVREDSALAKKIEEEGLKMLSSKGRASELLSPGRVRSLTRQVAEFGPKIVLLNASHELKLGGLVCKLAGVPHIVFRRGVSYPLSSNLVNRWFMRKVANAFLANGNTTFNNVAKAYPIVKTFPHAIIPNGIDLSKFEHWESKPVPGRIMMSARLSPEKGIERALRVMATLSKQHPEAELHIFGTGSERTKLEQLAAELNITQKVFFEGFVSDIIPQLAQASIFLFTPLKGEGTSFALLEAMAAGLPCVAFESPSLDEVIIDQKTGYLLPPDAENAMSDRLHELLENDALRQRMGTASRRRAFDHFSIRRLVDQLLIFFQKLH